MTRSFPAWLVVMLMLVAAASGFALAQPLVQAQAPNTQVLSGPDIGFRVEGVRNGSPTGTLVVRVKDKWVPVTSTMSLRPLTE